MFESVKKILKKTLPDSAYRRLQEIYYPFTSEGKIYQKQKKALLNEIRTYYQSHVPNDEIKEILDYLPMCKEIMHPYKWAETPKTFNIDVYHDSANNLPYVLMDDKRLYFPEDWTDAFIQSYYYGVQIREQNPLSPHRYLTDDFNISPDDIVVDLGVAEGNFGLDVVDKVKKIYLFEPEEMWMKPLKATFAPWKEKVEIVQKYVSDTVDENTTTIDDYFIGKDSPTFFKLDIEGFEREALLGGTKTLASNTMKKVVTCVYHRQDDEEILGNMMKKFGFTVTPSKGYLLILSGDIELGKPTYKYKPPYFRRGVIHCNKDK